MKGQRWVYLPLLILGLLMGCRASPPPVQQLPAEELKEEALQAYKAKEWSRAATLYARLAREHPQDADVWIYLGWAYKGAHQYQKALEAFAHADRIDPHRFWSAYGRAQTYALLGRWEDALKEYQRALDIDPHHKHPHYERIQIYQQLKQYDAAADAALFGLYYFPNDPYLRMWSERGY